MVFLLCIPDDALRPKQTYPRLVRISSYSAYFENFFAIIENLKVSYLIATFREIGVKLA